MGTRLFGCIIVYSCSSMLDPWFKLPKYLDEHQTETVKSVIVEKMHSFSPRSSPKAFEIILVLLISFLYIPLVALWFNYVCKQF